MRAHLLKPKVHGRPVVNAEFAYYLRDMSTDRNYWQRDVPGTDKEHSHTRESFRRAAWALAMAGGYFVAGFGTTYYGGWREAGPFDVDAPKNDVGEADLTNIRKFFTGLKWWTLQVQDAFSRLMRAIRLTSTRRTWRSRKGRGRSAELELPGHWSRATAMSRRWLASGSTIATGDVALPDHERRADQADAADDQDWVVWFSGKTRVAPLSWNISLARLPIGHPIG